MPKIYLGKSNTALIRGDDDVRQWDDEELLRGSRRSSKGDFRGRPPAVVPKAVHDEMVRRKMQEAHDLLRDNLVAAVQVFAEIATDKEVDPAVRLKAAEKIVERVLGKVPDSLLLTEDREPSWAQTIRASMIQAIIPGEHRDAIPADHEDVTEDIVQRENHATDTRRRRRGA